MRQAWRHCAWFAYCLDLVSASVKLARRKTKAQTHSYTKFGQMSSNKLRLEVEARSTDDQPVMASLDVSEEVSFCWV